MPRAKFVVGDPAEVLCWHVEGGQVREGWLSGRVVRADYRMAAVAFDVPVFTASGVPVPDRVLWCAHGSPRIRRPERRGALLFDWGNTLMRVIPGSHGPMAGWPEVAAVPHAVETLRRLQPEWLLALATNAEDSDEAEIRAALRRVDLDPLLERIYCYRRIGHRKPSPEFFACILADLALPAEQIIMIGDDFANDVQAANAAGLAAVWLDESGRGPGGASGSAAPAGPRFRTIHDLAALPAALAELTKLIPG